MPPSVYSIHNFYQKPGGEDQVFADESALLTERGHRVFRYSDHNDRIGTGTIATAGGTVWSQSSYRRLRELIYEHKPDVAHFHNTFPLVSPAGYYAARSQGVPVVQNLSNFRLLCPGANLVRQGRVCDECIQHRSLMPALVHKCYRNSRPATAAVATMLTSHRLLGTWSNLVDVYIAYTEFARRKFIEGGLPPDRIVVKPHMVSPDPGAGIGHGNYALFIGRLSQEKGTDVLLESWKELGDMPLYIVGDGPLRRVGWPPGVTYLGTQSRERVYGLMRDARLLVVPSTCYEIGPLVVLEAFACGLPVIASDLGSMAERVTHGRTGLLFRPGDAEDLARQVRWAFDHPEQLLAMRAAARREYEDKYTPERNYKMLMDVYEMAMESARQRAAS